MLSFVLDTKHGKEGEKSGWQKRTLFLRRWHLGYFDPDRKRLMLTSRANWRSLQLPTRSFASMRQTNPPVEALSQQQLGSRGKGATFATNVF